MTFAVSCKKEKPFARKAKHCWKKYRKRRIECFQFIHGLHWQIWNFSKWQLNVDAFFVDPLLRCFHGFDFRKWVHWMKCHFPGELSCQGLPDLTLGLGGNFPKLSKHFVSKISLELILSAEPQKHNITIFSTKIIPKNAASSNSTQPSPPRGLPKNFLLKNPPLSRHIFTPWKPAGPLDSSIGAARPVSPARALSTGLSSSARP